jgi:hypothetical protein
VSVIRKVRFASGVMALKLKVGIALSLPVMWFACSGGHQSSAGGGRAGAPGGSRGGEGGTAGMEVAGGGMTGGVNAGQSGDQTTGGQTSNGGGRVTQGGTRGSGGPGGVGGPGGSGGPGGTGGGMVPQTSPKFLCTQILGAPSSVDWFIKGVFESYVGKGLWQRVGALGINHWAGTTSEQWQVISVPRCLSNADRPDRVVLVVWAHNAYKESEFVEKLRDSIVSIRTNLSGVKEIYLMPAPGKPGCAGDWSSLNFNVAVYAIRKIAGDTNGVFMGPVYEIASCDGIFKVSNDLDRLLPETAIDAAAVFGSYFQSRR